MTLAADTPASDVEHPEVFHTLLSARARGFEREAAGLDSSVELLRTIADVLDIRTVFPRVSEIANKMLPHDAMVMTFVDKNGDVIREAATARLPQLHRPLKLIVPTAHEFIVDDFRTEAIPVADRDVHGEQGD